MTTPIKPGQVYRDNDPRAPKRRIIVRYVDGQYVHVTSERNYRGRLVSRRIRALLKNFHTDGKPRRTGFSLVEESK